LCAPADNTPSLQMSELTFMPQHCMAQKHTEQM